MQLQQPCTPAVVRLTGLVQSSPPVSSSAQHCISLLLSCGAVCTYSIDDNIPTPDIARVLYVTALESIMRVRLIFHWMFAVIAVQWNTPSSPGVVSTAEGCCINPEREM